MNIVIYEMSFYKMTQRQLFYLYAQLKSGDFVQFIIIVDYIIPASDIVMIWSKQWFKGS